MVELELDIVVECEPEGELDKVVECMVEDELDTTAKGELDKRVNVRVLT